MTEDQFEKLAQMIKGVHDDLADRIDGGASETKEEFKNVYERLEHMSEQTDGRFKQLEGKMDHEFAHVYSELKHIRTSIDALDKERVGHVKETDHILTRLSVVEKQLGIRAKAHV